MATLADLFALQPATLPRYEGTLAEALLGGWEGKGQTLPPEFSDWAPPMPGKRGISDLAGAFMPLEQNSAGERRLALPAVIKGLPQVPQALADLMKRTSTGDYRPTVEDPMTGRMYDPTLYEDARTLAQIAMTGTMPIPAPLNSLRAFSIWHGSPHKFAPEPGAPLGRFRLDKRGTGEGTQAYGDGIYGAEERKVAVAYRDGTAGLIIRDGKGAEVSGQSIINRIYDAARQAGMDDQQAVRLAHTAWDHFDSRDGAHPIVAKVLDDLGVNTSPNGYLYKAEIDRNPEDFLDWDNPLGPDAPAGLQRAMNNLANSDPQLREKFHEAYRDQAPGSIYYSLVSDHAKTGDIVQNQRLATQRFREAGMPGVRYLDKQSRAKDAGTRNYVVFDDSLMKILLRE